MASEPAVKIGIFFSVTLHTGSHFPYQGFQPISSRHIAMTRLTGYVLFDVSFVVENNVFSHDIDLFPRGWGAAVIIIVFLSYFWMI